MTAEQIITAYKAVGQLTDVTLPFKEARGIAKLQKRLGEEIETIGKMERNLVADMGGEIREDDSIHFPTDEAAAEYLARHKELFSQDDDSIQLPKVDLSKCTSGLRLTPGAIDALEGIIKFD